MKILHFSDTHLGFSEYTRINPATGLNQREEDFYAAWDQVIEQFHTPRPTNRAIRVALESIQKISNAGFPFIMVAGNHETPRIQTTGSIFESIALFRNVYAAFHNSYEKFVINKVAFHCVPHCSLTDDLAKALHSIKLDKAARYNILVSHAAWAGENYYGMGEFNEQRLADVEKMLNIQFDYIALGHYHRQVNIKRHVCYSGSTEKTSLNESGASNGFLTYDLEKKEKSYHSLKTRTMVRIPPVDCSGLSSQKIYSLLATLAGQHTKDAIVQLVLKNLENDTFLRLDSKKIEDIFSDAFYLEKQLLKAVQDIDQPATGSYIDSLPIEFERYLKSVEMKELVKSRLAQLGKNYLAQFEKL